MKMISRTQLVIVAIFAISLTIAAQRKNKDVGFHLMNKIEIGGEGGWDYVFDDGEAHRLYVSHATRVIVIDTDSDKVVGEIAGLKGVHGIAIDDALGRGFISDGRDNSVTIFDTKTLKSVGTVKT